MLTEHDLQHSKRFALFQGVDEDRLKELLALGVVSRAPRGQVLMHEGDPSDSAYLVVRGAVKLSRLTEDGHRLLIGVLGPGSMVGEMGVLDGGPRSATAETANECLLVVFGTRAMGSLTEVYPEVFGRMSRQMVEKLRRATAQMLSASYDSLRDRVLAVLVDLARDFGRDVPGGRRIELPLTHQELAEMVGAHRPRVSTAVKDLAEEGLIARDGRQWIVRGGGAVK